MNYPNKIYFLNALNLICSHIRKNHDLIPKILHCFNEKLT